MLLNDAPASVMLGPAEIITAVEWRRSGDDEKRDTGTLVERAALAALRRDVIASSLRLDAMLTVRDGKKGDVRVDCCRHFKFGTELEDSNTFSVKRLQL